MQAAPIGRWRFAEPSRSAWGFVVPGLGDGVCSSGRGGFFRGAAKRAVAVSGIGVSR